MYTIIAAILTLGILILVHEWGHFIAAKMVGIRIEKFSIGFPPKFLALKNKMDGLWVTMFVPWFLQKLLKASKIEYRFRRKNPKSSDTEYTISWTPLGGYVKMSGMIDESLTGELTGKPWEFASKKKWQQFLTISGGVIMNTILAFIFFVIIIYSSGIPIPSETTEVGSLTTTEERVVFPAEKVGVQIGDVITSINNERLSNWDELVTIIQTYPHKNAFITWTRNGQNYSDSIAVVKEQIPTFDGIKTVGMLGIGRVVDQRPAAFIESITLGFTTTVMHGTLMARSFWSLISGNASMDQVGGPIMIAKMAGDVARQGWLDILYFMAIISVNLAFINILPIPGLDGGHLIIIIVESVLRKPLPIKVKLGIQQVGMLLLLGLILFVTINDLSRF